MKKESHEKSLILKRFFLFSQFLLLSVISTNFFGQTIECSKFQKGTFRFVDENMKNYIIKRDSKYQIETYQNKSYKFIVKWIDNCTYTLTPTKKTYKQNPNFSETGVLTVKIIEIRENSYIQSSKSQYSEMILTNELVKIE